MKVYDDTRVPQRRVVPLLLYLGSTPDGLVVAIHERPPHLEHVGRLRVHHVLAAQAANINVKQRYKTRKGNSKVLSLLL